MDVFRLWLNGQGKSDYPTLVYVKDSEMDGLSKKL